MKYELNICWLYPDLMGTYGDRGNVIVLEKRCLWRGIIVHISQHTVGSSISQIEKADLLFMGGAQDRQQGIVSVDIKGKKTRLIKSKINSNTPGLFICGAYQFMGKYYKAADGTKIPGLSLFDLYTVHPGEHISRAIGNITISWNGSKLVGFENHGGRTYLGSKLKPLGMVIKGYGNNEKDQTEGVIYKNAIGSYLHGPILSKNPVLADWLISKAIEVKYGEPAQLRKLDDTLEKQSKQFMLKRMGV